MLKDFKAFIMRGNVMDMAVGVIIGGAFGKIVTSLVNDVIMPVVGVLLGGTDFSSLKWVLTPAVVNNSVVVKPENALMYGQFIQNIVDFLIIAASVFIMVRLFSRFGSILHRKGEKIEEVPATVPPAPAAPTSEELLTEIRDILRKQST